MFLLDALKAYALYLAMVVAGTAVLMFLADSIGYLSYSDRPGPGWYGFHPNLSLQDAEFVLSFAVFTAYLSLVSIAVPGLTLLTVAIRRFSVHRAIVALVLVPLFAVATFWVFVMSGWFVAIDGLFVLIATGLSILYGIAVSGSNGLPVWKYRLRAF